MSRPPSPGRAAAGRLDRYTPGVTRDRPPPLSDAAGDYLKAIWVLSEDGPASTNAIAKALDLTAASVSGMLARLAEAGLIDHVRYYGATLTDAGRREALRLVRRHRLVETFMIRELGYALDEVHDEAEALEHTISDRFAERLAGLLDDPSHDPHGDPIPRADGAVPPTPDADLHAVADGGALRVARLKSQDPTVLAALLARGVGPGATVRVGTPGDAERTWRLEVDGRPCDLPDALARTVRGDVVADGA